MSQYVNSVGLFASLGNYNTRPSGTLRQPIGTIGTIQDVRLIPSFGSCGNNSLSNGLGNEVMNDGYFNLCNAYPNCGDSCTKYVRQMCPSKLTNVGGFQ